MSPSHRTPNLPSSSAIWFRRTNGIDMNMHVIGKRIPAVGLKSRKIFDAFDHMFDMWASSLEQSYFPFCVFSSLYPDKKNDSQGHRFDTPPVHRS